MNKKSFFSLLFALMLSVCSATGAYATKDGKSASNDTVTTDEKKNENKSDKDNDKAVKDDKNGKDEDNDEDDKDGDEVKKADISKEDDDFPELHSNYYLLADLDSGKILNSKNKDEKVYPASTTKILTAILVLERDNLDDVVTATDEAISPITMKHSNMGIRVGEQFTVEQLLYGMLVASANDAANVLAVHTAGSLSDFASLMNAKAREIGAEGSSFVNAHGFHDDDHYTTVSDLAKISCYAMKNEKFAEIVKTAKYQIPATDKYPEVRYLSNTNMLISSNKGADHIYKNAIGIKTGSTDEAGSCLVSAAESNGTRLLCIVMHCQNQGVGEQAYSYTDTRAMFDYGFDRYVHKTIAELSDIVESSKVREAKNAKRVSLSPEQEIRVLLPKDTDMTQIKAEVELEQPIKAPIKKGDALGSVSYSLNGEIIGTTKLVAANDVERDILLHIIYTVWDIISNPIVFISCVLLVILLLYARSVRRKKRRERRRKLRSLEDDYLD